MTLFVTIVKKDEKYRHFLSLRKTGIYALDTAQLTTELETLQMTRKFRTVQTSDILKNSQRRLIEASLETSSFRSRVVEIKMTCFKTKNLLIEHMTDMKNYLSTTYADAFKQSYSTIRARDMALDFLLRRFIAIENRLVAVIQLADMMLDDLDKTSYHIKHIIDALSLSVQRERNI